MSETNVIRGVILELFGRHHDSFERLLTERVGHLSALLERLLKMSSTLSEQFDAAVAAIRDDVARVSAEVATLLAGVQPGTALTQAQIDQLTAIDASLKAIPAAPDATPPAAATP